MSIKFIQVCKSSDGWQPVEVPSSSEEGKRYKVMVSPWHDPDENICECMGYIYREHCRHQREAMELVCGWSEEQGPPQTEEQSSSMICPVCGRGTTWQMETN